ncbi:MAG: hypothetical protein LH466_00980 [Sphingomonas bacterium]|nr:hypothetical protein [Sphingomonas bacterium]
MRLLFAAAMLAAIAVPLPAAAGQDRAGFVSGHQESGSVNIHRGGDFRRDDRGRDFRRDDRDDRHRDRGGGDVFFPYREYQGDSLWRADSFNDWWHERPNRAYPAWMARNQNCERQYWSGGGWRC